MGWSGGVFTGSDGTFTSNWAANWRDTGAATILASEHDALIGDLVSGINQCLNKDGSNAATGDLDIGGNRVKNITASANSDAGTYGKQVASGAYSSPNINLTLQDATTIAIDVSGLEAGTGGVDLTTAQTVAGVKTWSSIGSHAHAKFNGPTTGKVSVISSSSTPTCDTTATNAHFLNVNQNMTLNFTWPTEASDTQLGANWHVHGRIRLRWSGAGYTVGLNSTMLSNLTDYEIEGTHTTGSGEMSFLVYEFDYINGSTYATFAWVATP